MFVKYINEDVSFDDLHKLESELKQLKDEIREFENDLSRRKYTSWNARALKHLLSSEEIAELEDLDSKLSEYQSKINKLEDQYTETDWHRNWDGELEPYTYIKDRELATKLAPQLSELKNESSKLRSRIFEIEKKIKELSDADVEKRKAEFDIDSKVKAVDAKRLEVDNLEKELITKNSFGWVAEAFIDAVECYVLSTFPKLEKAYVRKDTDNKLCLYIDTVSEIDIDDLDLYEYYEGDDEFYLPDTLGEDLIADYEAELTPTIIIEDNDGVEHSFECELYDSGFLNEVTINYDDDEFDVDGDYTVQCTFKLKFADN